MDANIKCFRDITHIFLGTIAAIILIVLIITIPIIALLVVMENDSFIQVGLPATTILPLPLRNFTIIILVNDVLCISVIFLHYAFTICYNLFYCVYLISFCHFTGETYWTD